MVRGSEWAGEGGREGEDEGEQEERRIYKGLTSMRTIDTR